MTPHRLVIALLLLAPVVAGCGGCGGWTAAQLRLVEQVERGIDAADRARAANAELLDAAAENHRLLLDEAFDEDARERDGPRGELDAEWVIRARRGYAAGLDALAEQRRLAEGAAARDAADAEAARRAARRLREMLELQARLLPGDQE